MITQSFKEAFYFFRTNLFSLLTYIFSIGIMVIVLAQLLVPMFFGGTPPEEITTETIRPFAQLMNLIIQPIYTGGLITLLFSLASDQKRGIFSCLLAGIKRWPYMLLANVITTFLIFTGFLLFVLPGIWLFSRLFLVPYLVMLKKQTPFEAIANSYQFTRGYSMTILIDIILLIIIAFIFLLILSIFQLTHPMLLLLFLLMFQSMAYVIYYRHYEILLDSQAKTIKNNEN